MKRVAVRPPAALPISNNVMSSGGGVSAGRERGDVDDGSAAAAAALRNPYTNAAPATPPPSTATRTGASNAIVVSNRFASGLLKCLHDGVSWAERIATSLVLYITLRGYAMLPPTRVWRSERTVSPKVTH